MKVTRPNNWVWWQLYAGQNIGDWKGSAYTIREGDKTADDRVEQLREVVSEITRVPLPSLKKPPGYGQ
jgi:hypothetical protein